MRLSFFLLILALPLTLWASKFSLTGFHLQKTQAEKKIEIRGETAKGFAGLSTEEISQPILELKTDLHRFTLRGDRGALQNVEELHIQGKGSAQIEGIKDSAAILRIEFAEGEFASFHMAKNLLRISRAEVIPWNQTKISGNALVVDLSKRHATFLGAAERERRKYKPKMWGYDL